MLSLGLGHDTIFVSSLVVFVIALIFGVIAAKTRNKIAYSVMLVCVAFMIYCSYQLGIAAGVFH